MMNSTSDSDLSSATPPSLSSRRDFESWAGRNGKTLPLPPGPAIKISNLRHSYDGREVLGGIDLTIHRGELFGLLGPNGGGKTTLFRILSTLLLPSSGSACLGGADVTSDPHQVRRRICVVFQSPSLDRRLSLEENLRHQGHLYGLRGRNLAERISENLQRLGLAGREKEKAGTLSGGQQRRAEIAKALLHRPEILLLDEPTTGLDPGVRIEIWELLLELQQREKLTIFLSTHLLEEAERCQRVAILHKGRLVALGSPDQLRSEIGGDILLLKSCSPRQLQKEILQRYGLEGQLHDGQLRLEHPRGAEFLNTLLSELSEELEAVTLGKPTLEDLFLHHTGLTLAEGDED